MPIDVERLENACHYHKNDNYSFLLLSSRWGKSAKKKKENGKWEACLRFFFFFHVCLISKCHTLLQQLKMLLQFAAFVSFFLETKWKNFIRSYKWMPFLIGTNLSPTLPEKYHLCSVIKTGNLLTIFSKKEKTKKKKTENFTKPAVNI